MPTGQEDRQEKLGIRVRPPLRQRGSSFGPDKDDGRSSVVEALEQVKELMGSRTKKAIVERGYKVKGGIPGVDIVMPKNLNGESYYLKKKREKRCRSRAGVEGLLLRLKHGHRMARNYLSGIVGDKINTLLAATGYNM